MFMWMLHDILKCRVKYQNVTWYPKTKSYYQMFMWMLHDILKCRANYQNV
jgi:hypothetical protein